MTRTTLIGFFGFALMAGLAGCGGGEPAAQPPAASSAAAPEPAASSPAIEASTLPATTATRTVKLEVLGKGKSMQPIVYVADGQGTESNADLPWSKTVKVELTGAEQKVGRAISIVAGSAQGANGQLEAGKCRISVDGEEVVSGEGLCRHKLK
ncbi:hypothetical protein ACFOY2_09615 [Nonomuraea purpurea]|uniref:MmpS family membrane protein n=1 Tax=Nonomuraea purpurea TaxID=1849276 RepID=A0ABV8G2P0_9ACTN